MPLPSICLSFVTRLTHSTWTGSPLALISGGALAVVIFVASTAFKLYRSGKIAQDCRADYRLVLGLHPCGNPYRVAVPAAIVEMNTGVAVSPVVALLCWLPHLIFGSFGITANMR